MIGVGCQDKSHEHFFSISFFNPLRSGIAFCKSTATFFTFKYKFCNSKVLRSKHGMSILLNVLLWLGVAMKDCPSIIFFFLTQPSKSQAPHPQHYPAGPFDDTVGACYPQSVRPQTHNTSWTSFSRPWYVFVTKCPKNSPSSSSPGSGRVMWCHCCCSTSSSMWCARHLRAAAESKPRPINLSPI